MSDYPYVYFVSYWLKRPGMFEQEFRWDTYECAKPIDSYALLLDMQAWFLARVQDRSSSDYDPHVTSIVIISFQLLRVEN